MSALEKLKARARELKGEVIALYLAAKHPDTPWYAKLVLVAIVAYALSPIDLIPDFIPVVGLLDELILLPLGVALALKMVPASVMSECRARALERRPDGSSLARAGAVAVVVIWVCLIALAALWVYKWWP